MKIKLHTQILISMVLGILAGFLFKEQVNKFYFLGDLFIRLLRMVIVPLLFSSLVVAITSIGNIRKLGALGAKTISLFITTTLFASTIGLFFVNIISPGSNSHILLGEHATKIPTLETFSLSELLQELIPANALSAMTNDKMLGVIFFSILLGAVMTVLGNKAALVTKTIESLNEIMLKMTSWIMKLAPIGVFALIAGIIANTGAKAIKPLSLYIITIIISLGVHTLIVLFSLLKIYGGYNPLRFVKQVFPAIATGFSTASSIATLPVTIECLSKRVGVSRKVTGFVSSLGATMNMNGTAAFQTIAAVFIAQAYGIELTITQQIMIILTATLASIGAAGIPSGSLITIAIILKSINVPLEGIGLIIVVDRIIDMCRTSINVFGDTCAATIIAKQEGEDLNN
jgi:proton glutamate symport protein